MHVLLASIMFMHAACVLACLAVVAVGFWLQAYIAQAGYIMEKEIRALMKKAKLSYEEAKFCLDGDSQNPPLPLDTNCT